MFFRAAILAIATCVSATACGGSSPTAPTQLTCTPVTTSAPLTVRAGEIYRVRFKVPPGLTRDVILESYLGLPASGFDSATVIHRLYDRDTLLGEDRTRHSTLAWWKSPESTFGTPGATGFAFSMPAVSINYSSIVDGTIDGRAELAVTSGSVVIESPELGEVLLMWPVLYDYRDALAPMMSREWCR